MKLFSFNIKTLAAMTVFAVTATACQSTEGSKLREGTAVNDDGLLEFSCTTPANVDAAFKVMVIRATDPKKATLQLIGASGEKTSYASERIATFPGADAQIIYRYEAPEASLVVTVNPDPKPFVGKTYKGRWKASQDLLCKALSADTSNS